LAGYALGCYGVCTKLTAQNKTGRLCTHYTVSVTICSPFSSDQRKKFRLHFFFCIYWTVSFCSTYQHHTQPMKGARKEKKRKKQNLTHWWIITAMISKVVICMTLDNKVTEQYSLWVNVIIIDGDMIKPTIRDKHRNYKPGTNRKTEMMTNDTTPNLT